MASIASAILSSSRARSWGVVFFHDLERRRGGLHGAVHVLGRAGRDLRDDLVVGRVDDVGGPAIGGVDELPADELLVGLDALEGVGHGKASWGVTGRGKSVVILVPPR